MRRGWPLVVFALAACATAGEPVLTPPPPSFREVRSLVLLRMADDRLGRQKDPLDGLDETLRARGYTTRVVDLKPGKKEQAALERLYLDLEARAAAPRGERFGTRPFSSFGRGAADTVAGLGVDAVATYHRLGGLRPFPQGEVGSSLPGTVFPGAPVAPGRGPTGAIGLVDRAGHAATFSWGETTALDDPDVPVNAAEAIDLVLRALTGEPGPDSDFGR
jgi:hypothetical protein